MSGNPVEYGETKEATGETQQFCNKVRPEVEKKTNLAYYEFIAIEYREQIVEGKNFLIKVRVGGESFIHLKLFKPLSSDVELIDYQQNKTREDPLKPF